PAAQQQALGRPVQIGEAPLPVKGEEGVTDALQHFRDVLRGLFDRTGAVACRTVPSDRTGARVVHHPERPPHDRAPPPPAKNGGRSSVYSSMADVICAATGRWGALLR